VTAYGLLITLRHLEPPVWRRVVVPGSLTLAQLHRVIQGAMGWGDEVDGVRCGWTGWRRQ